MILIELEQAPRVFERRDKPFEQSHFVEPSQEMSELVRGFKKSYEASKDIWRYRAAQIRHMATDAIPDYPVQRPIQPLAGFQKFQEHTPSLGKCGLSCRSDRQTPTTLNKKSVLGPRYQEVTFSMGRPGTFGKTLGHDEYVLRLAEIVPHENFRGEKVVFAGIAPRRRELPLITSREHVMSSPRTPVEPMANGPEEVFRLDEGGCIFGLQRGPFGKLYSEFPESLNPVDQLDIPDAAGRTLHIGLKDVHRLAVSFAFSISRLNDISEKPLPVSPHGSFQQLVKAPENIEISAEQSGLEHGRKKLRILQHVARNSSGCVGRKPDLPADVKHISVEPARNSAENGRGTPRCEEEKVDIRIGCYNTPAESPQSQKRIAPRGFFVGAGRLKFVGPQLRDHTLPQRSQTAAHRHTRCSIQAFACDRQCAVPQFFADMCDQWMNHGKKPLHRGRRFFVLFIGLCRE